MVKSLLTALAVLFLSTDPVDAQNELRPLGKEHAEISIVGDDSFITKRFYRRLSNRSIEGFEFKGGGFGWTYADPNIVAHGGDQDKNLSDILTNTSPPKRTAQPDATLRSMSAHRM